MYVCMCAMHACMHVFMYVYLSFSLCIIGSQEEEEKEEEEEEEEKEEEEENKATFLEQLVVRMVKNLHSEVLNPTQILPKSYLNPT